MKIKDGQKKNGSVWLNGRPVALIAHPQDKLSSKKILENHVKSQREYIKRLTESVESVEAFLKK
jgi:hypothetical protein